MLTNSTRPRLPATWDIRIEKSDLGELRPLVREVSVQLKRNASGTADIVFDSYRNETGRWVAQDNPLLQPWNEVQINAVFDGRLEGIVHGFIREVKLEYPEDMSGARVTVTVQDDLLKLDREHHHRVLTREGQEQSDGTIVREIARYGNLQYDIAEGMTPRSLEINGTYAKFLLERAEANGFEVFMRGNILHFHPPSLDSEPQPTILVYAGASTNCRRFSVNYNGHHPDAVKVTSQLEKNNPHGNSSNQPPRLSFLQTFPEQTSLGGQSLTSEGRGLPPFVWSIDKPSGGTQTEMEIRARSKANANQFKIAAEGVLDGTQYGNVLLPHLPVTVDGVGATYNGRYYVEAVTHKFSGGIYEQQFKLLRNAIN